MLQRLEVKNFLALRDVSLDLEPFTVLVGANASGKTTILEALHRVCALRDGNHRVLVTGTDPFQKNHDLPSSVLSYKSESVLLFGIKVDENTSYFTFTEDSSSGWLVDTDSRNTLLGSDNERTYFGNHMGQRTRQISSKFPPSLLLQANFSSLSKPSVSPLPKPYLERNGAALATICSATQQEFPDAFALVQEQLAQIIHGLKRFRIHRVPATKTSHVNIDRDVNSYIDIVGSAEELIFDFDDAIGVPAKYVSEGTLLVLCILVAAARFEGEALILIDDLERGLHPKAVRDLIGALRKLQEINPKLQIVATSHSPYILSELKPQEVRVVARDAELGTVVGRLTDHPDFAKWSEVMDVGEFWSHVGEDWLLKRKEYA